MMADDWQMIGRFSGIAIIMLFLFCFLLLLLLLFLVDACIILPGKCLFLSFFMLLTHELRSNKCVEL